MGTDELDVDRLKPIGDSNDQAVAVAFDIEDHAIPANETGMSVLVLDGRRTGPGCRLGFVMPGLQRLLGIGVVLWALTWLANRFFFGKKTYLRDPEQLASEDSTLN